MNIGKDTIQIAQDLLVRKLGELSGVDNNTNNPLDQDDQDNPDFDFYAQHFERPIQKAKMEAIQVVIEEGFKNMKKMKSSSIARPASMVDQDA